MMRAENFFILRRKPVEVSKQLIRCSDKSEIHTLFYMSDFLSRLRGTTLAS